MFDDLTTESERERIGALLNEYAETSDLFEQAIGRSLYAWVEGPADGDPCDLEAFAGLDQPQRDDCVHAAGRIMGAAIALGLTTFELVCELYDRTTRRAAQGGR